MLLKLHILLAAASVFVSAILFVVILWRRYFFKDGRIGGVADPTRIRNQSLHDGIARLHHHDQIVDQIESKRRGNYYNFYYANFRRGVSAKPLFNWADHPSLITDAVENGWSRFGFTGYMSSSSPSTKSSFLRLCAVGDYGRQGTTDTEISWEVCQESADFMQKIRLNSGLRKIGANFSSNPNIPAMSAASVIRTALPLPGPPLGNSSFPQEAYFEITVLDCWVEDQDSSLIKAKEGEKTKLIQEDSNAKGNSSECFVHVEELRVSSKDDDGGGRNDEAVVLSVGLTAGGGGGGEGGSLPFKLPGTYPGSIGFNSNGSVYLDGIKVVFESEKAEWGRRDRVIGCGFDPRQKKVFFTLDAELVHVIDCKSEEFGTPLYPTIAADIETTVLVNFGQSVFTYVEANAARTPNPCFIGALVKSPALGYDDSKELFSMGRIDSQWQNRGGTNRSTPTNNRGFDDYDEESEADLFEIVLDVNGRSPYKT